MSKNKPPVVAANNERQRQAQARAAEQARAAKKRLWMVGGIAALVTVAIICAVVYVATAKKDVTPGTDPWGARTPESGKGLMFGQPGNKVQVKLYEDALCSHCIQLEDAIGGSFEKLAQEGKMTLEIYPMSFQGVESATAANGLACAAAGGFVAKMHSAVMDQGQAWDNAKLKSLAEQIAPEKAGKFERCVATKRYDDWAKGITQNAVNDKVTTTPTLLINGVKANHGSLRTEADFVKLLDEAASK